MLRIAASKRRSSPKSVTALPPVPPRVVGAMSARLAQGAIEAVRFLVHGIRDPCPTLTAHRADPTAICSGTERGREPPCTSNGGPHARSDTSGTTELLGDGRPSCARPLGQDEERDHRRDDE